MGSFTGGIWNILIIVLTVGGIFAMFWLVIAFSKDDAKTGAEPGAKGDAGRVETMGHVWDDDLEELNNPLPGWWRNMFYITLVFSMLYLLLYPGLGINDMFLGWTQIRQYEEEQAQAEAKYGPLFQKFAGTDVASLSAQPEALKVGRRLYTTYCTGCHGSDAGGARGFPNLRDDDWLYGGTPEAIETTILDGRQGMMPAWSAPLGGEEGVSQMVHYVLSLSGRDHDASAAAIAAPKYSTLCAACHGAGGKGNRALGAPDLTDDVWLYGASPGAINRSIAIGRAGQMPAQKEFLGEAKVHLLAAYIYSLSR
ncbi:MAG: cytochrome-c oxidase, cbb3-type subunit III [Gammaproteobacteria bacterium]